jgi:hypothetical protein
LIFIKIEALAGKIILFDSRHKSPSELSVYVVEGMCVARGFEYELLRCRFMWLSIEPIPTGDHGEGSALFKNFFTG